MGVSFELLGAGDKKRASRQFVSLVFPEAKCCVWASMGEAVVEIVSPSLPSLIMIPLGFRRTIVR